MEEDPTNHLNNTITFLAQYPQATDEELMQHLGLQRPASARFWRQKAENASNDSSPRDTGPLDGAKNWFSRTFGSNSQGEHEQSSSHNEATDNDDSIAGQFKTLRKRIVTSGSGSSARGHLLMAAIANFFAYIIPFCLIAFVGTELGAYFAQWMVPWSSYGLAYSIELGAALLTVKLGHVLESTASNQGENNGMVVALVVGGWLLLNGSSAVALWMILTNGGTAQGAMLISALIRVGGVAILDFSCACALMVKSANAKKEIEHMKSIASNIELMAAAQRSIEEAEKNAKLRDQMMQATLKIQEDMSKQIGQAVNMIMTSIMEKMEKALKEDGGKNERGFGRK